MFAIHAGPNCRADRRAELSGPFSMRPGFLNSASGGGSAPAPAPAAAAESKDDGAERGAPRMRVAPADEAAEAAPAKDDNNEEEGSEEGSGDWETASEESA